MEQIMQPCLIDNLVQFEDTLLPAPDVDKNVFEKTDPAIIILCGDCSDCSDCRLWLLVGSDRPTMSPIELSWTAKNGNTLKQLTLNYSDIAITSNQPFLFCAEMWVMNVTHQKHNIFDLW